MSGIDGATEFAYSNNDEHFWTTLGQWVDGLFVAHNAQVQTVDATTQRLPLSDGSQVWQLDQNGNPFLKDVTGVVRIKLSTLPAYQLLKIRTHNNTFLTCLSTTPVCTRVNNVIDGKTADQWQVGDMICGTLHNYQLSSTGTRPIEYAVNKYSAIPSIITGTWGELSMSRTDALNFLQVCFDYPDQVDPGDAAVFNEVLGEMAVYDPVMEVTDVTSSYTKQYVYWVETDNNCFQIFQNSAVLGYPVPGPAYAPLQQKLADQIKTEKGSADVGKVLKSYNKESQIETGPLKLEKIEK